VKYTLVADIKHEICQAYDVEHADGVAFRGAFLIDQEGNVRAQIVNDLPLGRNIDELIRLVDALQFHEEHGEVCPAGWNKGDKGMSASPEGVAAYLAEESGKL
jgi:peroxiredoxin (alkyl hydroperoxide reductase subunit C)